MTSNGKHGLVTCTDTHIASKYSRHHTNKCCILSFILCGVGVQSYNFICKEIAISCNFSNNLHAMWRC